MRPAPLLLPLALAACGAAGAATRAFPVDGFDKVRNATPFEVRVHVGGAPGARAEGAPEVLDRLELTVRDGELVVGTRRGPDGSGWRRGAGGRATVDVTLPVLTAAGVSGPGDMRVDHARAPAFAASVSGPGNLAVAALEAGTAALSLSGPGNIDVAGRVGRASVDLSGPGDVRAKGLATRDATVSVAGPGTVDLAVSDRAVVSVSGPGGVRIAGHPRCTVRKTGPGDVRCG